jgi:DNA-binding SARP family transcriptional activator
MPETAPTARTLHLRVLGPFRAAIDGAAIDGSRWPRRKPLALVKLLAVSPRHRLHREQVLDVLWPELDAEAAANQLYKALHGARRALEPDLARRAESSFVVVRDGVVCLEAPGGVVVDADEFERAAGGALREPDPSAGDAALAIYGDDLLPEDRYAEWADARRERLRLLRLRLMTHVAERAEALGDADSAVERYERLVALDPADEAAHRALIRLHATLGRTGDAARQLEACRSALARELDAEPEAATLAALAVPAEARPVPIAAVAPARTRVTSERPAAEARRASAAAWARDAVPGVAAGIARWRRAVAVAAGLMLALALLLPAVSASGRFKYRLGRIVSKAERLFGESGERLYSIRGRVDRPGVRVEALDSISGWATISDADGAFTVLDLLWQPGATVDLVVSNGAGAARLFHVAVPLEYPEAGSVDVGLLRFGAGRSVETDDLFGVNSVSYIDYDSTNAAYYRGVFDALALGVPGDEARVDAVLRFVSSRYEPKRVSGADGSPRRTLESGSECSGLLSLAMATVCRAGGYPVRLVDTISETGARQSHQVVEVYYGGRWHLYDPSYGVAVRDGHGRVVGYSELRRDASLLADVPFASVPRRGWKTDQMPELFASGIHHIYLFRSDASLDGA